jgi:hypothetical protein
MSPEVTAAVIAASVSFLTLIGTLAAQYFGRRATSKQLDRALSEQRTRTLNERFATAAEQLGSEKPAVRLAGVYAMAGLADDWEKNQQTCVDVLCAYLRMPYEPEPKRQLGQENGSDFEARSLAFQASREVRHTIIRVITAHLREDAAVTWQGLNFDFTGVVFDGGDFSRAQFSRGKVDFSKAQFSDGDVDFTSAQFSGSTVDFNGSTFSGSKVHFTGALFSGGTVHFYSAEFSRGAIVVFYSAKFSRGPVVDFRTAQFSGGKVDFSDPADWSFPPTFPWTETPPIGPWTETPPTGVKLPKKEDQSPP